MRYGLIIVILCIAAAALEAQECQTEGNMIKSVSVVFDDASNAYGTRINWSKPDDLPDNAIGYDIYEYHGVLPYCVNINVVARIIDLDVTTHFVPGMTTKSYAMALALPGGDPSFRMTQQHRPPVITAVDFNPCNYQATISWTPYVGWDKENTEYAVYVRMDAASTYTLLAEHITDTAYVWTNAPTRENIAILVEAVNKTDVSAISKSQPQDVFFDFPRVPDYIHLSAVDYAEGKTSLTFNIDPATELTRFEVQRAADGTSFTTVTSFSDKTLAEYMDESGTTAYRYRIVAKNDCDSVALAGDTLANIVLQLQQENNHWRLQWENALSSSMLYTLGRLQPQPAVLLSGSPLITYTDNIPSMINEPSLAFCYRVEGAMPSGAKSRAQACTNYTPVVVMPDAVDPLNTTMHPQTGRARHQFGPVINVNEQTYSYRLTILNRNGAVVADIYKTTADHPLDKSWDGRLRNGDPAPEEVFTYHLSVEFEGGDQRTMTGAVTVMYSN